MPLVKISGHYETAESSTKQKLQLSPLTTTNGLDGVCWIPHNSLEVSE